MNDSIQYISDPNVCITLTIYGFVIQPVRIETWQVLSSNNFFQGMKTGSATVTVRLASEASYTTSVYPAEVDVLVSMLLNIFVSPSLMTRPNEIN